MVIIVEGVGVGVREVGTRSGRDKGVDRWAVRSFQSQVRKSVLVKARIVRRMNFIKCIPKCTY